MNEAVDGEHALSLAAPPINSKRVSTQGNQGNTRSTLLISKHLFRDL
jgi:hypothetical protein